MSEAENPLCTSCKRKPAVYKRTYSGELLCIDCLERSLEKAVRRSLGETGLLRPRTTLLVPISLSATPQSLALARLLANVERRYGSRLIVAVPSLLSISFKLKNIINIKIINIKINYNDELPRNPIECARLERRWWLETARQIGAQAIISPYTRTDLILIMLHAVLSGDSYALSEALHKIDWTQPPIISGFHRVEGEAILAYASLKQLLVEPVCIPDLSLSKLIFYSIAGRRPELEFSSSKSIDLLASPPEIGKCVLCGGYTRAGEPICKYCKNREITISII